MKKEQIIIGTPVIYWGVIKENGERSLPLKTEITSEVWMLGSGELVCNLKGKSGGFLIEHLDEITTGSLMAAKLQGLKEITDDDLITSTTEFFKSKGINIKITT